MTVPRAMFVLVAGPPGSGKSLLATPLAQELGVPLLAKDEIKESLMAVLAVARASPGAVLDSTFYPYTVPHLEQLPGTLIEVRCRCPRELAQARYEARSAGRRAGHLDAERPPEELWNRHHLVALGLGPLIEVDTSDPVDVGSVAGRIRALAGRTV
jgi:ATPase family associated with various cellular activities (AAA)